MTPSELSRAIGICRDAGKTKILVPIKTMETLMAARIGKAKITTKPGARTTVEPAKPRRSVAARIGDKKKAKRAIEAIEMAAPGRVRVTKMGKR
jgi:hypothetical protein